MILILGFILGVGFGGLVTVDEYEYKLDKCQTRWQDSRIALDECKGDLKLCELRQDCNDAIP